MSEDPVLTAHEVAEEIRVHYQTVRGYILRGELKATKQGNRWLIRRSWVEEFVDPTRSGVA